MSNNVQHRNKSLIIYNFANNKNYAVRFIYSCLPVILTAFLYGLLAHNQVLVPGELENGKTIKFSFLNDVSNCVCMPLILFLSYYLWAVYPRWLERAKGVLDNYISDTEQRKNSRSLSGIAPFFLIIIGLLIVIAAVYAVKTQTLSPDSTKQIAGETWMSALTYWNKIYYILYLLATAILGFSLLVYALRGTFDLNVRQNKFFQAIENALQNNNKSNLNMSNLKYDLQDVAECISFYCAYALFYVAGIILIIIIDNMNEITYGTAMLFSNQIAATCGITIITIVFIWFIIPAIDYSIGIRQLKRESRKNRSPEMKKICKDIELLSSSVFDSTISKLGIFVSIIVPSITLAIQIIFHN